MTEPDLRSALRSVVEAFSVLGIGYFVGGSVASSAYGLPRTTLDVDLVADMERSHVAPLVERLRGAYYIDAQMVEQAIVAQRSFNVIHLDTMLKVDVFVLKQTAYDREAFRRAQSASETISGVVMARPEDVILHKLMWFRRGGSVSERQWRDVQGVLKVQEHALDLAYMQRWAPALEVADLLREALLEAGLLNA